jgi:hypothetical protein
MVSINIKKNILLNLLDTTGHKIEAGIIQQLADVVEKESGLSLVKPLNTDLYDELHEKFTQMESTWTKLGSAACQEKYRSELHKLFFKIQLTKNDIQQDSLYTKFAACQQVYESTWMEKYKLEANLKKANVELNKTTHELERVKNFMSLSKTAKELELMKKVASLTPTEPTPIISELLNMDPAEIAKGQQAKQDLAISNYVSQCLMNQRMEYVSDTRKIKDIVDNKLDRIQMIAQRKKIVGIRKNYFDISVRQRQRNHPLIKKLFEEAAESLKTFGLCLANVEIHPSDLDEGDYKVNIMNCQEVSQTKKPNVNNLLFYKDKFSISDKCYMELKVSAFFDSILF